MEKVIFENLKFGDKIARAKDGKIEAGKFLCFDSVENYAYVNFVPGGPSLAVKSYLEKFQIYTDGDEFFSLVQEARKQKAEDYREWLRRYENDELDKYEI